MLAAAALLVSPTFVLGFLSFTLARTGLFALATVAYGLIFSYLFEAQTPVGVPAVTEAYQSLAQWISIVGSGAPFLAGYVFRHAWKAENARVAVSCSVAAFCILAAGSYVVTQKIDDLTAESNISVGRSEALSTLEQEAAAISKAHPGSPAAWTARFLSSKVAGTLLGVEGPKSLDDFVQHMEPANGGSPR
jgi:hypothetical protein